MAYIDSELAKRRQPASSVSTVEASSSAPELLKPNISSSTPAATGIPIPNRQPATQGKLQEIDLGPSQSLHNANRTAQALDPSGTPSTEVPKAPKPRIGRDGKPYIPKPRKRRDSDALRRDALVDTFLSENSLGIYEAPAPNTRKGKEGNAGNDEEADEAMEEAFRREFMDAVASRAQMKKPTQVSTLPPGKKGEEELKGPKLGGSRSARAAHREALLKEQAKTTKR
jgi:hypothetical protein